MLLFFVLIFVNINFLNSHFLYKHDHYIFPVLSKNKSDSKFFHTLRSNHISAMYFPITEDNYNNDGDNNKSEFFQDNRPITNEDFENAKFLTEKDYIGNESILYSKKIYHGDIIQSMESRNALRDLSKLWPNGKIPYLLSKSYSTKDRAIIAKAMETYHEKTCIKFVPKERKDRDYIHIQPGYGCGSMVGRQGGYQQLMLGVGCVYVGTVEHEFMHSVGFYHEQSRTDRDKYVKINWDAIEPGMEYNFEKIGLSTIQFLDEPYDYSSIMHYGPYAFAKGFKPTIEPLKQGVNIGQRVGLSPTDIRKINKLYQCSKKKSSKRRALS